MFVISLKNWTYICERSQSQAPPSPLFSFVLTWVTPPPPISANVIYERPLSSRGAPVCRIQGRKRFCFEYSRRPGTERRTRV